jgi:hypothetical protein
MSRSYECYDCRGRTEKYDDAYCSSCGNTRALQEAADEQRTKDEDTAAVIMLQKMGFTRLSFVLDAAVKASRK